jgi:hypothetical protein
MPLTADQRAELETLGPATVRIKLVQAGAGRWTSLVGFKTGEDGNRLTRGDVEDWLIEKAKEERDMQRSVLRWSKIAGWSAIVGVVLGLLAVSGIGLLLLLFLVPSGE